MQPRRGCREVEVKGAFPGADVVRGKDWNLEDQDGKEYLHWFRNFMVLSVPLYLGGEGGLGKIIILIDVQNESYVCVCSGDRKPISVANIAVSGKYCCGRMGKDWPDHHLSNWT